MLIIELGARFRRFIEEEEVMFSKAEVEAMEKAFQENMGQKTAEQMTDMIKQADMNPQYQKNVKEHINSDAQPTQAQTSDNQYAMATVPADISFQINQLTHAVLEASHVSAQNTQTIINKLEGPGRKGRKVTTRCTAAQDYANNVIGIIDYNEGEAKSKRLIMNARGPLEVGHVIIEPDVKAEYFYVNFTGSGQTVYCKIDGLSEETLYQSMVRANICFNKRFSKSQIKDAMFTLISPLVDSTEDVYTIKPLGGWHGEHYLHKNNFPLKASRHFSGLPIMTKELSGEEMTVEVVKRYCKELHAVKNASNRTVIMLVPFIGMMSSLYEAWGKRVNIAVNLIPIENVPLAQIVRWFNLTKPSNTPTLRADMTKNKLIHGCSIVRDEVLLVDTRMFQSTSDYKKDQGSQKIKDILDAFMGISSLEKSMAPMELVLISNAMLSGHGICNIILGPGAVETMNQDNDSMKIVYASFIHYIEKNFQEIETLVKKRKHTYFSESEIAEITWEILRMFWNYHGYSLEKISGITIKKYDLTKFFGGNNFDDGDLSEAFIKALRAEISLLNCREKLERVEDGTALRYNDEYIWIPGEMFARICKNQGLSEYEDQILMALIDDGIVCTSSNGSKTKLQCMGVRPSYYKMSRAAFNKLGLPEIMTLIKNRR